MNSRQKAILLFASNMLQQLSSLVILYVLTRWLGALEYSNYLKIDVAFKTLIPVVTMGIPVATSYFLSRATDKGEACEFVAVIIVCVLAMSGLLFVSLEIIRAITSGKDISTIANMSRLFYVYLFLEALVSMFPNILIVTNENLLLAAYSSVAAILRVAFVFLAAMIDKSALAVLTGLMFVSIFKASFCLLKLSKWRRGNPLLLKKRRFVDFSKYAFIVGVSQLVGTLSDLLDRNIVLYFFKPEQFAVFSSGAYEIPFIGLISGSIAAILLPRFAAATNDESKDLVILAEWKNAIVHTAVLILPIFFILQVFAEEYISLVFSAKYVQSVEFFRVYLFKIPIMIATYSTILLAKKKNNIVMVNSIAALFLNALLNIVFIHFRGMKGVSYASIVSLYSLAFLQVIQIGNVLKVPFAHVLPLKDLAKVALINVPIFTALFIIKYYFKQGGFIVFTFAGIVGCGCSFVLAVRMRLFDFAAIISELKLRSRLAQK